jgi:hypothetical protein
MNQATGLTERRGTSTLSTALITAFALAAVVAFVALSPSWDMYLKP